MLKKAIPVLLLLGAGCESLTGSEEGERVAVRFATSPAARSATTADELVISGSNGTLSIGDIRFIVSEFELKRAEDFCVGEEDDDDCEEIEGGPFLVDLPLGSGAVTLTTDQVPAGTYTELEFEVENLDEDEDDDAREQQLIQSLYAQIRSTYPNFPREASMVVRGTFTPTGGSAQPFVVYFDAEIEIEKDLNPPLTVPGSAVLTVNVNPALWFRRGTQVLNLAALNGRRIEFEAEIDDGFEKVEIGD